MRKCPYCDCKTNGSSHIYFCVKKFDVNKNNDKVKFDFISYNFPEVSNQENFTRLYNEELYSLPMIREKFGIDYKSILFLIKYFNIKKRGISESGIKISSPKNKKTCQLRYKTNNVSQVNDIKKKKIATSMKNFGVTNIWRHKDYYKIAEAGILKKYGMESNELRSICSKRVWNSKSLEEKNIWLDNSIRSYMGIVGSMKHTSSKIEYKIIEILEDLNLPYERQFYIKDDNAKYKSYDIRLKNSNIIIEINGDYWHANPKKYKPTDILKFPFGEKMATEIWKKDEVKRLLAESHGLIVKYIWENDIRKFTKNELINHVKCIVNENSKN